MIMLEVYSVNLSILRSNTFEDHLHTDRSLYSLNDFLIIPSDKLTKS